MKTSLHKFALGLVAATLGLIFLGGLVKTTGASLSVPDWPLSYGSLMPPMIGGILFEHGH
jgi:cytochrome c oxidase assembly protein subunit 15